MVLLELVWRSRSRPPDQNFRPPLGRSSSSSGGNPANLPSLLANRTLILSLITRQNFLPCLTTKSFSYLPSASFHQCPSPYLYYIWPSKRHLYIQRVQAISVFPLITKLVGSSLNNYQVFLPSFIVNLHVYVIIHTSLLSNITFDRTLLSSILVSLPYIRRQIICIYLPFTVLIKKLSQLTLIITQRNSSMNIYLLPWKRIRFVFFLLLSDILSCWSVVNIYCPVKRS